MLSAAFLARTFLVNGNSRCSSKYHSSSCSSSLEKGSLIVTIYSGPPLNITAACQLLPSSPRSWMLISCAMPTSPCSQKLFVDVYGQDYGSIGLFRLFDVDMPARCLWLCLSFFLPCAMDGSYNKAING